MGISVINGRPNLPITPPPHLAVALLVALVDLADLAHPAGWAWRLCLSGSSWRTWRNWIWVILGWFHGILRRIS